MDILQKVTLHKLGGMAICWGEVADSDREVVSEHEWGYKSIRFKGAVGRWKRNIQESATVGNLSPKGLRFFSILHLSKYFHKI